ncbi:hypothetical protein K402DRAFT_401552 [Aulographum hederae CBS 113979]|uniref:TFIIS N-terminal domain-containing protein n=1 Tax=Aulographum hederae CBS 113979 TaxID=1176131 RepID=A0A6G1HAN2_9PEZI|nr:hypothetical protein K402DRAFT_401552 [Aulographum hederae CBS 113979]
MPEAGRDPSDPLAPEVEEENSTPNPSAAAPDQDVTATGTNEVDKDAFDSDSDGALSDLDDEQFEDDFNADAINITQAPAAIAVDDSNVALLGVHKRKRAPGEEGERKKKKKEGRRDRPSKKSRRRRGSDDEDFAGGEQIEGSRRSRKAGTARKRTEKTQEEIDAEEADLPEDERRARALERRIDEGMKKGMPVRRRKGDIDLDAMADAEIEDLRKRMTAAAAADADARGHGLPATQKLQLLPEVTALLNRTNLHHNIVDPEINLLEAVRFFLEPLTDGSLPAYQIQREMFSALQILPIQKDALVASGIGKVVLFYNKSNKPEREIKRIAEKLVADWTRPLLNRTDDYRKRELAVADYDPHAIERRKSNPEHAAIRARAEARAKALATPSLTNRARMEGGLSSYKIVPQNNISVNTQYIKAPGAEGEAIFRRMKARQQGKGRR